MSWDLGQSPYVVDIEVVAAEIDGLGHANNAAYVSWLERCAPIRFWARACDSIRWSVTASR